MCTSDEQDAIVKQLEDRYDGITGTPQPDGSLVVVAVNVGRVAIQRRTVHVARDGAILSDHSTVGTDG